MFPMMTPTAVPGAQTQGVPAWLLEALSPLHTSPHIAPQQDQNWGSPGSSLLGGDLVTSPSRIRVVGRAPFLPFPSLAHRLSASSWGHCLEGRGPWEHPAGRRELALCSMEAGAPGAGPSSLGLQPPDKTAALVAGHCQQNTPHRPSPRWGLRTMASQEEAPFPKAGSEGEVGRWLLLPWRLEQLSENVVSSSGLPSAVLLSGFQKGTQMEKEPPPNQFAQAPHRNPPKGREGPADPSSKAQLVAPLSVCLGYNPHHLRQAGASQQP